MASQYCPGGGHPWRGLVRAVGRIACSLSRVLDQDIIAFLLGERRGITDEDGIEG